MPHQVQTPKSTQKNLYKNSDFQQQFVLVGDEEDR